jgi:hypothetical protein
MSYLYAFIRWFKHIFNTFLMYLWLKSIYKHYVCSELSFIHAPQEIKLVLYPILTQLYFLHDHSFGAFWGITFKYSFRKSIDNRRFRIDLYLILAFVIVESAVFTKSLTLSKELEVHEGFFPYLLRRRLAVNAQADSPLDQNVVKIVFLSSFDDVVSFICF